MGADITCAVTLKGKTSRAKARLETNALQLRGSDVNVDVPFKAMKKVVARGGRLSINHPDGTITLALGKSAGRWAEKILHPPSRLSKLGVRPEWRAAIVGRVDADFIEDLQRSVATLSVGRVLKKADAIFVGVSTPSDLLRLATLKSSMNAAGAVWLIRPKGSAEVTEGAVMAAGKAVGLVDVKVVAFSPTHSALKFVIPLKDRPR